MRRLRTKIACASLIFTACGPYVFPSAMQLGREPYYAGPFSVRISSQATLESYCKQVNKAQQRLPANAIDGCYDHERKEMAVKEDPYSVLRSLKLFFETGGKESYVFSHDMDLGTAPYKIGPVEVSIMITEKEKYAMFLECLAYNPKAAERIKKGSRENVLGCTFQSKSDSTPRKVYAGPDPYVILHEFIFHVFKAKSHED